MEGGMRTIVVEHFGEPDVLHLVEREIPAPGMEDVLIKVEAIGVNPVDTYIRAGQYPVLPHLPYTPGKDVSGVVEKVGAAVKKWREGDRVYSAGTLTGGYAEYTVCHQSQIFSLPDNMQFVHGAAMGVPGAAAWRGLFTRARAQKDEKLLVHGASGSVGIIAIQLATSAGLEVHGTAGSDEGIAKILRCGVQKAYNHNLPGYIEEIADDLGEDGYDIILEMLANRNLNHDLALLAIRGRVVIIGSRGEIPIDPRATMAKETEILGMSLFSATEEQMKEAQVAMFQQMATRGLIAEIAMELDLAAAATAHHRILQSGNCGKIILLPRKMS